MVDSYWDLYVAYIAKCVRDNWINDIDPHHYKMEWNHTLPQCIFKGHGPGQWLTLKQHAIASALQTLAFEHKCLCGWHKSYLSPALLELAWPYYRRAQSENGVKGAAVGHAKKDERGRSVNAVKNGSKRAVAAHAEKDEFGRSLHALKIFEGVNDEKDELGRSVNAVKGATAAHKEKDENGKSVVGVENGKRLNAKKDELGRSVSAMKCHKQIWQSTVDGFRGNAGNVAYHNKTNGWDPAARIRVS
jgi:hypothetical protein